MKAIAEQQYLGNDYLEAFAFFAVHQELEMNCHGEDLQAQGSANGLEGR